MSEWNYEHEWLWEGQGGRRGDCVNLYVMTYCMFLLVSWQSLVLQNFLLLSHGEPTLFHLIHTIALSSSAHFNSSSSLSTSSFSSSSPYPPSPHLPFLTSSSSSTLLTPSFSSPSSPYLPASSPHLLSLPHRKETTPDRHPNSLSLLDDSFLDDTFPMTPTDSTGNGNSKLYCSNGFTSCAVVACCMHAREVSII